MMSEARRSLYSFPASPSKITTESLFSLTAEPRRRFCRILPSSWQLQQLAAVFGAVRTASWKIQKRIVEKRRISSYHLENLTRLARLNIEGSGVLQPVKNMYW